MKELRTRFQAALGRSEVSWLVLASLAAGIFLTAFSVRVLYWQDLTTEIEIGRMRFGMTEFYEADARNLLAGRTDLFVRGPDPPSDTEILTHPPGYPLFLAVVFGLFGGSPEAVRWAQIVLDSLAAVIVFLIAYELLPAGVAALSGLAVAIAPQIVFNSLVLLPDAPAVVPILVSVYLLARAIKKPSGTLIAMAGLMVGLSCWLRPNGLLLSIFLSASLLLLLKDRRWRYAGILSLATVVVIVPITMRNIVVFGAFIPLSLGVGHNLSTGIADKDETGEFGMPKYDHLAAKWEAEFYGRPDYGSSLYAVDGIDRDRDRFSRASAFIVSHPVWFCKVMMLRAAEMLAYENTSILSRRSAVTDPIATARNAEPVWTSGPPLEVRGDSTDIRLNTSPIPLTNRTQYVLRVDADEQGQGVFRILAEDEKTLLASAAMPGAFDGLPDEREKNSFLMPFTSGDSRQATIRFSPGPVRSAEPVARVTKLSLHELGSDHFWWSVPLRVAVRWLQKFFVTQWMLPLAFLGLVLLLVARFYQIVAIVSVVPVYYLLAQAPLHTEFRYVVAIHYFIPILAATAVYCICMLIWKMTEMRSLRKNVRSE